jgi:hypothetical protein
MNEEFDIEYCAQCGKRFGISVHTEECISFYRSQRENEIKEIN